MTTYKSFDQLPLVLCANDVAAVLGISRSNSYALLHRPDFPSFTIGKRILVSRDKLLDWIEEQLEAKCDEEAK